MAGLVAAGLIAVDPLSIFYATEARPYALLQLLAVMHVGLTAEIVTRPNLAVCLGWVFVGAAPFHLHYTAALLLATEVLFVIGVGVVQRLQSPYPWSGVCRSGGCSRFFVCRLFGMFKAAHRENWAAFVKPMPIWGPSIGRRCRIGGG